MRGSDQRKKVQEQLLENLILLGLKLLHPRSQFLPLSLNGSCVISFSLLHRLLVALQLLLEHLLNHRDNDNHIPIQQILIMREMIISSLNTFCC